jgi:hypothetical protein
MTVDLPQPGQPWTTNEIRAAVESYFAMLALELQGVAYSKAAHRGELLRGLPARSKGSIEYKHQNISAVLTLLGAPHIAGYKPAANFQSALVEEVARQLEVQCLPALVADSTASSAGTLDRDTPRLRLEAPPPPLHLREEDIRLIDHARVRVSRNVDWAARDSANRSLGILGEHLVLDWEKFRLRAAGLGRLASRVVHASKEEGDGLGYDIRSFALDGSSRLIEVKTTAGGASTPFVVSQNEVAVSERESARYSIARVYSATSSPAHFELAGSIPKTCRLRPSAYHAVAS